MIEPPDPFPPLHCCFLHHPSLQPTECHLTTESEAGEDWAPDLGWLSVKRGLSGRKQLCPPSFLPTPPPYRAPSHQALGNRPALPPPPVRVLSKSPSSSHTATPPFRPLLGGRLLSHRWKVAALLLKDLPLVSFVTSRPTHFILQNHPKMYPDSHLTLWSS